MEEKKYLKWYNKVGYGAGDIAGNVVYVLLAAFVIIYLTDTVGLNSGIVGTLIAVSKIFDGISDVFFGAMIDKTKSKMGKARPWMLYGHFGCVVCLVAIFCIPVDMGQKVQYAWFFIAYTLLNAGFYTANNIAYSALTALITKNNSERVQMASIRFMFAFGTSMLIQAITVGFVAKLGGGEAAWRTVAIIYAVIGVIANTLSVLSVKELSDEGLAEDKKNDEPEEKYNLISAFKILVHNKYFLMICGSYLLMQLYSATLGMGIYFMKYILGDECLFSTFSWAINMPMIVGLLVTPILVAKFNVMYKLNAAGYVIGTAGRLCVIAAVYMGNINLMLAFTAVAALGMSPLQGDMNALIATTSEYTRLTTGKKVDGTMYSCTSFGTKVCGGLGTAISGWMLAASGYVQNAASQSQSCVNMFYIMYLWLPMIFNLIITFILIRLSVEKANKEIQKHKS